MTCWQINSSLLTFAYWAHHFLTFLLIYFTLSSQQPFSKVPSPLLAIAWSSCYLVHQALPQVLQFFWFLFWFLILKFYTKHISFFYFDFTFSGFSGDHQGFIPSLSALQRGIFYWNRTKCFVLSISDGPSPLQAQLGSSLHLPVSWPTIVAYFRVFKNQYFSIFLVGPQSFGIWNLESCFSNFVFRKNLLFWFWNFVFSNLFFEKFLFRDHPNLNNILVFFDLVACLSASLTSPKITLDPRPNDPFLAIPLVVWVSFVLSVTRFVLSHKVASAHRPFHLWFEPALEFSVTRFTFNLKSLLRTIFSNLWFVWTLANASSKTPKGGRGLEVLHLQLPLPCKYLYLHCNLQN